MQEISAGFCGFNFPVIGKRRCAASQKLSRYVISSSSVWQRLGEFNNICSKLKQPVFEVVSGLALEVVLSVRNLSDTPAFEFNIGRSTLGVRRFLYIFSVGTCKKIARPHFSENF
jgi:hypothetical protein